MAIPIGQELAQGEGHEVAEAHSELRGVLRGRSGQFAALWLVTRNSHEAEEIMQDAFLKLWERWDRVNQMDDPTGYLYRTAMTASATGTAECPSAAPSA